LFRGLFDNFHCYYKDDKEKLKNLGNNKKILRKISKLGNKLEKSIVNCKNKC
jgi:hypothetical protein